jgi:hypothetical protein
VGSSFDIYWVRKVLSMEDSVSEALNVLYVCAEKLHIAIESSRTLTPKLVDLEKFELRAQQIASLRLIHDGLSRQIITVARWGQAADALHSAEVREVQTFLGGRVAVLQKTIPFNADIQAARISYSCNKYVQNAVQKSASQNFFNSFKKDNTQILCVEDKTLKRDCVNSVGSASSASSVGSVGSASSVGSVGSVGSGKKVCREEVYLSKEHTLNAIIVPHSDSAQVFAALVPGELNYVPAWNHFAVKIGNLVLHGNIGTIFSDRDIPVRVKECRHRSECNLTSCSYYHNPAIGSDKKDIRGYLAGAWHYIPALEQHSARYGSRRLGSRPQLLEDLQSITAGDARRFLDQVAHDVVCAALLEKYVL